MQKRERNAKYEWSKINRELGSTTEKSAIDAEPLSPYSPDLGKYHASKETLDALNN